MNGKRRPHAALRTLGAPTMATALSLLTAGCLGPEVEGQSSFRAEFTIEPYTEEYRLVSELDGLAVAIDEETSYTDSYKRRTECESPGSYGQRIGSYVRARHEKRPKDANQIATELYRAAALRWRG